jgi:hypothetical protein
MYYTEAENHDFFTCGRDDDHSMYKLANQKLQDQENQNSQILKKNLDDKEEGQELPSREGQSIPIHSNVVVQTGKYSPIHEVISAV